MAMRSRFNRLTPNDLYMSRTAPLTSKRCILYIYSTNIGTEYFKHALYSPSFSVQNAVLFHNANLFGFCIIHILYTGCVEIKKNNSGASAAFTSDIEPRNHKDIKEYRRLLRVRARGIQKYMLIL